MKIKLSAIGKTAFKYIDSGIQDYEKRINRYNPFKIEIIPNIKNSKNMPPKILKQKEGKAILSKLKPNETLILLDERGKNLNSKEFSSFLQQKLSSSSKQITFLIGGAYGFSEEVYKMANFKLSLSKMTFSHQIIRLIFLEQLYRAFTILNNEPYHNE